MELSITRLDDDSDYFAALKPFVVDGIVYQRPDYFEGRRPAGPMFIVKSNGAPIPALWEQMGTCSKWSPTKHPDPFYGGPL